MKKFLIISLFVFGLIFTGCSQQKRTSQNELFDNQIKCENLRNNIYTQIIKNYNSGDYFDIIEILYSPVRNSCLYTIGNKTDYGRGDDKEHQFLYDYFSPEPLLYNKGPRMLDSEYYYISNSICQSKLKKDFGDTPDVLKDNRSSFVNCMNGEYFQRIKKLKGK